MVLMLKNLSNSWEKKFNKYDTGSIAKNKNKKIRSNVKIKSKLERGRGVSLIKMVRKYVAVYLYEYKDGWKRSE